MTNSEIATELAIKSISDLVQIANETTELIIATWTEQEQGLLESALSAEGVEVSGICSRKKAPPPPET